MPDHPHFEDDELFNRTTKHEDRDVPVKPLMWALVALIVFGLFAHFVVYGLYKAFAAGERAGAAGPASAVPQAADAAVPKNQPLLQPFPTKVGKDVVPPFQNTPATDLLGMRKAEAMLLDNYGWVDRQHGVARIPISVAKQILVQRGLPAATVPAPQVPVSGVVTAPAGAATAAPPAPAAAPAVPTPTAGAAGAE